MSTYHNKMSMQKTDLNDILFQSGLAEFTRSIKLGKFERSYDVAKRTLVILTSMVRGNDWPTARHLIEALKGVCAYIDGLGLVETAAGNMTRRIMRIVRDECQNFNAQQRAHLDESVECSNNRDETKDDSYLDLEMKQTDVKENILEGIEQELMNELQDSSKSIAQQAIDYIASDEIILTLGKSKIIEKFLKYGANGGKTGKRKFTVIVAELAPFYSGREMAKSLSNINGISTLIVPDSAVFAIMSRVNKVIIGCHSMMANGGIKAPASSHSIALAAKHFSVPLVVCCPMYKLTPEYLVSHDDVAFKRFSNLHAAFPEPYTPQVQHQNQDQGPDVVADEFYGAKKGEDSIDQVPISNLELTDKDVEDTSSLNQTTGTVEALHSTFDYVPPELITLFVSNIGGNSPSYVYQLLNELYCKSDYLD